MSSKFGTSPPSEGGVPRFLSHRLSSGEIGGTDGKESAVAVAGGGSSSSSSVQVHPNVLREARCARGGGAGAAFGTMHNAAGKLPVRAVEAVETRDGRTLLLCLVSERGLDSEVRFFIVLLRLRVFFLISFLVYVRWCWLCWIFLSYLGVLFLVGKQVSADSTPRRRLALSRFFCTCSIMHASDAMIRRYLMEWAKARRSPKVLAVCNCLKLEIECTIL